MVQCNANVIPWYHRTIKLITYKFKVRNANRGVHLEVTVAASANAGCDRFALHHAGLGRESLNECGLLGVDSEGTG